MIIDFAIIRYVSLSLCVYVCVCVLKCPLVRTVIDFTQASYTPVTPLTYDNVILG